MVRMIQSYRGVQANESGRGVNFGVYAEVAGEGVYAEVAGEGVVRVGDPLSVRPPEAGHRR